MNYTWRERLEELEKVIKEKSKERGWKDTRMMKKIIAEAIIGFPYYWGEYSGKVIPYEKDETRVTVHIVEQNTGGVCYWTFESLHVYEQLQKTKQYKDWDEFDRANKLQFAKEYEQLLGKYKYTSEEIDDKMKEFCQQFKVNYKNYYVTIQ